MSIGALLCEIMAPVSLSNLIYHARAHANAHAHTRRYFRFSAPVGEDYVGVWRNPSELSIEVLSLSQDPHYSLLRPGKLQLFLRAHDSFDRFGEPLQ